MDQFGVLYLKYQLWVGIWFLSIQFSFMGFFVNMELSSMLVWCAYVILNKADFLPADTVLCYLIYSVLHKTFGWHCHLDVARITACEAGSFHGYVGAILSEEVFSFLTLYGEQKGLYLYDFLERVSLDGAIYSKCTFILLEQRICDYIPMGISVLLVPAGAKWEEMKNRLSGVPCTFLWSENCRCCQFSCWCCR